MKNINIKGKMRYATIPRFDNFLNIINEHKKGSLLNEHLGIF